MIAPHVDRAHADTVAVALFGDRGQLLLYHDDGRADHPAEVVGGVSDAAGDDDADIGLDVSGSVEEGTDPGQDLGVGEHDGDPQAICGGTEATEVTTSLERAATVRSHDLVDAVSEDEAVVEDRDPGVLEGSDVSVHGCEGSHG